MQVTWLHLFDHAALFIMLRTCSVSICELVTFLEERVCCAVYGTSSRPQCVASTVDSELPQTISLLVHRNPSNLWTPHSERR